MVVAVTIVFLSVLFCCNRASPYPVTTNISTFVAITVTDVGCDIVSYITPHGSSLILSILILTAQEGYTDIYGGEMRDKGFIYFTHRHYLNLSRVGPIGYAEEAPVGSGCCCCAVVL